MTTQKIFMDLSNPSGLTKDKNTPKKRGGKRADHEGSIYYWKARKLWVASVRMGINPKTGKDVRKKKYAHSQKEALAALQELKVKYAAVSDFEADTITLGQWLSKWIEVYVAPKVRGNTLLGYKHHLKAIVNELGCVRLCKITEYDLQQIIWARMRDKYRTAEITRTLLRTALRKAVKCHLLESSPAEDLELPPKPHRKTFRKPDADDWQMLLNYQNRKCYCWRWIILTEYVTGTRLSELLALHWSDIDIQQDERGNITGGIMHIQHALYVGEKREGIKGQPLYLGDTKTQQGNRCLFLPASYCYELRNYRKLQLAMRMKAKVWKDDDYVFTHSDGTPISPAIFSTAFWYVRRKLGIATTFHMLRHDMASRMKSSQQFDMKDIQAQLGHSSIRITMDIYTHINEDENGG